MVFTSDTSGCAIAELLYPCSSSILQPVFLSELGASELQEEEKALVEAMLHDKTARFFSTLGWIDQVVPWFETVCRTRLRSKKDITQLNAGTGSCLACFKTEDGQRFWLKATGERNHHELGVTVLLSELASPYLPKMIATRTDWNAWLMSGDADSITECPIDPVPCFRLLEDAVTSMAELQLRTVGHTIALREAGSISQDTTTLLGQLPGLFDFLYEAMAAQTSMKVPRLDKRRLEEICRIAEIACYRMEDLNLPLTIVHGDLNLPNILTHHGSCLFIDWCEAYIGCPLISLQHLMLLNRIENRDVKAFVDVLLKDRYKEIWSVTYDPAILDTGFLFMPLVAIISTLYGRGDWLHTPRRNNPRLQQYARTLARCMDREAKNPSLQEWLRH
jgi:hypothetical protein